MIQERSLMPGIEFRIKTGADKSLQDITNDVKRKADEYGIPVAFKPDQVADGLAFGSKLLLGTKEECVVLFHPENEKFYLRYVIRAHRQGTYLFIIVNKTSGHSPDSAIGRATEATLSVFPNQNHWYTIIDDIFKELYT